jgi:hypothetical protein
MNGKDLFEYAWVLLVGGAGVIWQLLTSRIENNHKVLNTRINETNDEVERQRDVSAKLFDKLEQHTRDSTARHIEILNYLRDKH